MPDLGTITRMSASGRLSPHGGIDDEDHTGRLDAHSETTDRRADHRNG
jgi:hypothetical protein